MPLNNLIIDRKNALTQSGRFHFWFKKRVNWQALDYPHWD
ncbi:hypothetical protein D515_02902 [Grimontia indica]|uniref:Uncharacterized protein n=1 Tax=Grimontia indica TaxID=1056512 RepID=R1IC61_9GAMM|nr:hypothetical protein D515_02902 [Grimontia indica]